MEERALASKDIRKANSMGAKKQANSALDTNVKKMPVGNPYAPQTGRSTGDLQRKTI